MACAEAWTYVCCASEVNAQYARHVLSDRQFGSDEPFLSSGTASAAVRLDDGVEDAGASTHAARSPMTCTAHEKREVVARTRAETRPERCNHAWWEQHIAAVQRFVAQQHSLFLRSRADLSYSGGHFAAHAAACCHATPSSQHHFGASAPRACCSSETSAQLGPHRDSASHCHPSCLPTSLSPLRSGDPEPPPETPASTVTATSCAVGERPSSGTAPQAQGWTQRRQRSKLGHVGLRTGGCAAVRTGSSALSLAALRLSGGFRPKLRINVPGRGTVLVDLVGQLVRNDAAEEVEAQALGARVLLPGRSRFLLSDIARLQPLLGQRYDLVVVDPPWENASARRRGAYATLPHRHLLALPLAALTQQGALVAVWMTNRPRLWDRTFAELLPAWRLAPVALWVWLKVIRDGRAVTPLHATHRYPFEQLLLLRRLPDTPSPETLQPAHVLPRLLHPAKSTLCHDRQQGSDSNCGKTGSRDDCFGVGDSVPTPLCIVSLLGEHSRKPHLSRLLTPYAVASPCCLELFSRQLSTGWTAWGNEVLYFQDVHLFKPPFEDK